MQRWAADGTGPFASNIAEAGAFVRTHPDLEAPDVQFRMVPAMFHEEGLGVPAAGAWGAAPCVLTPTSRGSVTLRGTDPHAKPRILHRYLATADDRRTLTEGVRIAMRIAAQAPISTVTTGPHRVPESDSDPDILDFAARAGQTVYHPVGTCSMGSVVDAELRVNGVDGLRVVDASVMPTVPRGNTAAPTMMIAERAADLVGGRSRTDGGPQ